jgi:hypothetical protein
MTTEPLNMFWFLSTSHDGVIEAARDGARDPGHDEARELARSERGKLNHYPGTFLHRALSTLPSFAAEAAWPPASDIWLRDPGP